MNELKNIVVGIDFSERSKDALIQAARIANLNQSNLHAVHVVEKETSNELALIELLEPEEIRLRLEASAKAMIQDWQKIEGLPPNTNWHMIYGNPVDELVQHVKQVNANLFVAGVRGTMNDSLGAGAQAARLVRKAPCKVRLVKKDQIKPCSRVVACIDFSATSQRVVEQAIHVAKLDRSKVHFLHIFAAPWKKLHYKAQTSSSKSDQAAYLKNLKEKLTGFAGDTEDIQVSFHLEHAQHRGFGISQFANKINSDIVIIGTRSRWNLNYFLLARLSLFAP